MSSDTETVIDSKKVRTLWHRRIFRGSELQVTVAAGGVGKILDFGIVANVPSPYPDGFSPGDIDSVLVEFGKMLDSTAASLEKYFVENSDDEPDVWEPPEGWIPMSEQDIQDWESTKCEVVYLDVARRGG